MVGRHFVGWALPTGKDFHIPRDSQSFLFLLWVVGSGFDKSKVERGLIKLCWNYSESCGDSDRLY